MVQWVGACFKEANPGSMAPSTTVTLWSMSQVLLRYLEVLGIILGSATYKASIELTVLSP